MSNEGKPDVTAALEQAPAGQVAVDIEMLRLRLETLREIQDAIKTADNKANFLVAFYTVVMFVAFPRVVDFWNWYAHVPGRALSIIGFVTLVVLLLSLIVSIWHFKQCAWPRLDSSAYVSNPIKTSIFWLDIAEQGYQGLGERLKSQSNDDALAEVAQSLYVNSRIARDKYYHVRQCYWWLLPFILSFVWFMALVQAPPR